jgi:hypothetical protein
MHSTLWSTVAFLAAFAGVLASPCAWANDVSATSGGGKLKIKGDVDPNVLTLDQAGLGGDQVRVTPTGTTINGAVGAVIFGGVTKGVVIDLGGGDDQLAINSSNLFVGGLKLKTGPGSDTVTLTANNLGPTTVDLGVGDNAFALCGGSTAKLSIKVGAGAGAPRSIGCPGFGTSADGSAIVLASVGVTDKMKVKGSKANESFALFGGINQQKTTLDLGGGSDALALCVGQFNESLTVKTGAGTGSATATCGGVAAMGANAMNLEAILVLGKFGLKMGASSDAARLKNDVFVEAVKLDLGKGDNTLTVEGNTFSDFTSKSSKGDDMVQFTSDVSGDASVNGGAGNNTVTFGMSQIGGDLTVKTGGGNDTIDVSGATVGGTTTIANGKGMDTVTP